MTQKDKWAKRPIVETYWSWCDEIRKAATDSKDMKIEREVFGVMAFFHIEVPRSYSEVKKRSLFGTVCDSGGDTDNMSKGLIDALFKNDKGVSIVQGIKMWCEEGEEPSTDVFLLVN